MARSKPLNASSINAKQLETLLTVADAPNGLSYKGLRKHVDLRSLYALESRGLVRYDTSTLTYVITDEGRARTRRA